MSDHYQTLGVDRNASPDDIKKAYRRMAAQHHPDRGGDTAKFQDVQAAYETLSDPGKRQEYDNPQPQMHHHFNGHHFNGVPPEFQDIFSNFGFHFGGFRPPPPPQRNRTLNMQTSISLEDAFTGKNLIANVQLPSGREQMIDVTIPKGVREGTVLRLSNIGDDSIPGQPRGDIHLTINILPHDRFKRENDDLLTDLEVPVIDAILGGTQTLTTLDGKSLEITIKPGTSHGTVLSASGYGMPSMHDDRFTGRLLITIKLKVPTNLTEDQKNKLREVFNK